MPTTETPLPRDPDEPIFGTCPTNPALLTRLGVEATA